MNILAWDTTRNQGSVALVADGRLVESVCVEAPNGFGSELYQAIDRLLARHPLQLSQIDAFAAAAGPGSFTGIRVGLTAAKALAEVHGKRVVPVSNLKALARAVDTESQGTESQETAAQKTPAGNTALRVAVIDARRSELYAAGYHADGSRAFPAMVCDPPALLRRLADSSGCLVFADESLLHSEYFNALGEGWTRHRVQRPLAGLVAQVALDELRQGRGLSPEAVEAEYIRRPDAEVNWKGV